jgi:hypothetical protein
MPADRRYGDGHRRARGLQHHPCRGGGVAGTVAHAFQEWVRAAVPV